MVSINDIKNEQNEFSSEIYESIKTMQNDITDIKLQLDNKVEIKKTYYQTVCDFLMNTYINISRSNKSDYTPIINMHNM